MLLGADMRIIFVNRYFFPDQSATSRVISSIAFALVRRGFEVAVVASRNIHNQPETVLATEEVIDGVRITRLRSVGRARKNLARRCVDYLLFHFLACLWLLRNARSVDTAVVCTDPPLLSVTTGVVLRIKGAVMVNWIMDLFPEIAIELGFFSRLPAIGSAFKSTRNWSLRTRGVAICPTGKMAEYLHRNGLPRERLAVMHHWSDGEEIYPVAPSANSLRKSWGLHEAFVVGYSGNFGRAHDFKTIIEAAALLRDRDDIRFLLIGGGHQHAAVVEMARKLRLDNIIFKPLQPVANLAESMSVADVHLVSLLPELEHCIIPSKFYGILAAGRPTIFIGDPDGEVPRVLDEIACGESVTIGAADELAKIIETMQRSPAVCTTMGQAARTLLSNEYSREKAADNWSALVLRLQNTQQSLSPVVQEV